MIKAIFMDFGDTIVVEEEGKRLSDMELRSVDGAAAFMKEFSKVPIVIISNTIHSSHTDIERLLTELGLLQHVRKVITSLDFGVPKPDPRIFQAALDVVKVKAAEAIMIGDRVDMDILGADRAGIPSIHLHWRARHDDKIALARVQPTYRAENYEQVSQILKKGLCSSFAMGTSS